MSERRAAFIQSMRDCADFLERHPTVQAPVYVVMNVFVNTRDVLSAHARVAAWEKVYNGPWFMLQRTFGEDLSLEITAERETVCRKVVTGKSVIPAQPEREVETVEWVCEDASLLAEVGG